MRYLHHTFCTVLPDTYRKELSQELMPYLFVSLPVAKRFAFDREAISGAILTDSVEKVSF